MEAAAAAEVAAVLGGGSQAGGTSVWLPRPVHEHHSAPRSPPCQTSPPPSFPSSPGSVVMLC